MIRIKFVEIENNFSLERIAIIGAGIAGLTCAIMLNQRGFKVSVFESAEEVRGIGAGIGLASNAIKAFEYLGLDQDVVAISNHLMDFEIADWKGNSLLMTDTERIRKSYNAENFAVHRADLHRFLLSKIPAEQIHTNKELIDLKNDEHKIEIRFEDGSSETFDFLIAADGVNSKVRQLLIPKSAPRYAGYWCWRGVVESKNQNLQKSVETWGEKGRFGVTPLTNDRIYWYACINSNLQDGISDLSLKELQKRFGNYHKIIPELLKISKEEELISNPIMDLKPISKYYFDRVLLIGDAGHATTPNMGQGACMAIEDVAVLQDELLKNDIKTACQNFEKRRLKRTHYITKTSRNAGMVAQSENRIFNFIRNQTLKFLPDSISQYPLKRLLEEDFMKIH